MKITKSQLAEAIKKEVSRLHKINIMETRLKDLNRELRLLKEGSIFEMEDEGYEKISFYNFKNSMDDQLQEFVSTALYHTVAQYLFGEDYTDEEGDRVDFKTSDFGYQYIVTLDGDPLIKVWVNGDGNYDYAKNSAEYGDERFFLDKDVFDRNYANN